jgi:hypothetical protein
MAASALKNISTLSKVCGMKAMPNVFLVTTMWGDIPKRVALLREQELYQEFWKPALDEGARAMRFNDSFHSAWEIIDDMLEIGRCPDLLMQLERVEQNRPLEETQAFIPLNAAPQQEKNLKTKMRKLFSKLFT